MAGRRPVVDWPARLLLGPIIMASNFVGAINDLAFANTDYPG
jgi:hypothetical protein